MVDTGHKLSFDLLSHFKEADSLKQICSSTRSVFSWSDEISEFGKHDRPSLLFNFIKKVLHEDKCQYLFKIMWEGNASLATRENIGRTVVRSLLKAIKILHICREDPERRDLPVVHENRQMIIEVVRTLFGILTDRQFQQKWNRFLEYLELL